MNVILAKNLKSIADLCRTHGVSRVEAFGSVLTPEFGPRSDIDLLVAFERKPDTNAFNQYFEFKESLERILERPVDLVCANSVRNQAFRKRVENLKVPLFAA